MAKMGVNIGKLGTEIDIVLNKISDKEVGAILRGAAIKGYKYALELVPQYSGYMASNLTISGGNIPAAGPTDRFWNPDWHKVDPVYEKGDSPAMDEANSRNSHFNNAMLTIESTVTIGYAGDKGYFETVEGGHGTVFDLRDVNKPSMALTVAAARIKYEVRDNWWQGLLKGERI